MRLKRYLAAIALVMACKKPPPPEVVEPEVAKPAPASPTAAPLAPAAPKEEEADEGPLVWVSHSGDGTATLHQRPGAPGKCFLDCTLGSGETAWKATGECMAEKADWRFLSNDCSRTIVMIPAPPRAQKWRQAQVMRVYKKEKLEYPVVGIAALPDEKLMKGSRSWLKGCYGVPGDPPHYSTDGSSIEYVSIDDKEHTVPLIK